MNKIVIKNVSKIYDNKKKALNDVNLVIENGMFGILGRNGSGKSTLMKIIATILKKSEGSVVINDIPLEKTEKIRELIGYLPQDFDFYPNMKVEECLYYLGILSGMDKNTIDSKIEEVLKKVNLFEHKSKKVKGLSGGMKKRLGIAQAIIHDPSVIIVDEPTAGLDPEERVRLRNLLSGLAEDKIVIISTHIVSDIESICKDIAILDKGKIEYTGSISDLIENAHNKVYDIIIPNNELISFRKENVFITKINEYQGHLKVRFVSDEKIQGSEIVAHDFEDAYMYFLQKIDRGERV
ncbi:ABC transporter ATP-binding protein [Macrococcoides caseolyticum]|uniref:ABC transporter ATP-binding protein n=1 Tax=Macrococcoides caseolyticum TaxID=69966 RepID=UPI001F386483|nr:ABC transporter ATP-binding protein [Macrococcus caseolyticus]MCE4957816.1 ABC transporter ATP-binding protein [Macrococcus caseolyticus]